MVRMRARISAIEEPADEDDDDDDGYECTDDEPHADPLVPVPSADSVACELRHQQHDSDDNDDDADGAENADAEYPAYNQQD